MILGCQEYVTICNQWFPYSKKLGSSAPFGLKKAVPKENAAFATRFWGVCFYRDFKLPTLFLFKEDFTPRAFCLKSPRKWECIPLENFWKRFHRCICCRFVADLFFRTLFQRWNKPRKKTFISLYPFISYPFRFFSRDSFHSWYLGCGR